MPNLDLDQLLALLRDPNVESQAIAAQAGVPREEAGRAARLLMVLPKAKPEEVVTLPGPLAAALARAALAASRIDLLSALAGHGEKEAAKEAKRCLHVLRTRGVDVPEAPRLPAPAPAVAPAEAPLPALSSAPDGHGERVVWLTRALPGRGIEVGQAVISDERGLISLELGTVGRKEWRSFSREIVERGEAVGVTEVPRERVHAWVVQARALNERTGQRVPNGTDLWLNQLGPAAPVPEPGEGLAPAGEEQEQEAVAASAKLLETQVFRTWFADEEFLRKIAAKLDEVQVSPLYIDEQQRSAQIDRVLADAAEEYLDPSRRERLSARLMAAAAHLLEYGDEPAARMAAAVSRAIAAGKPAASVPFARLMVERAFSRAGAPKEEEPAPAQPGGSLIVPPR